MARVGNGRVNNEPRDRNLTICGDLMFSTVFRDPELCKGLIETATDITVDNVRLAETQRHIGAGPFARAGIVDVLVMDTQGNAFDIEMQNARLSDLPSRARYYGALVDVTILDHSDKFSDLKRRVIVFICSHDPFDKGLKRYTCQMTCRESGDEVNDGQLSVFLNAEGTKGPSTPRLDAFLAYVRDGSMMGNEYVAQVDAAVRAWRNNPVWKRDLMLWELKYRDELVCLITFELRTRAREVSAVSTKLFRV